MANEAAYTEGESISESWHGIKTHEVDAGVEEAPAKSSDTAPR